MLAIATGKQKRLCEEFIKELFQIVASELESGEGIRIKGFGTFRLVEVETRKSVNVATGEENRIPGYRKVSFTPSKELAAAVNKPFEDFVAVEISDDLSTEELLSDEIEITDEVLSDEAEPTEELSSDDVENADEVTSDEVDGGDEVIPDEVAITDELQSELDGAVEETEEETPTQEEIQEESAEEAIAEAATYEAYYQEEESEKRGRGNFIWGAVVGFVVACILGAAVFILWGDTLFGGFKAPALTDNASSGSDTAVVGPADVAEPSDSLLIEETIDPTGKSVKIVGDNPVATIPSDVPVVVDTVTTTRYLTTIARMHYGNFNLWPLIYEENEKILGHPDRIRPGTKVVVPPLSKFGIDPENPKDVEKIKKKGLEIYSRYKK